MASGSSGAGGGRRGGSGASRRGPSLRQVRAVNARSAANSNLSF